MVAGYMGIYCHICIQLTSLTTPPPGAKPPDTSLTRVISRGKSNYVEEKLLATRRQDTNYNIVGYIITTDSFDAESIHTKNVATKYNLFITILGGMHIPTC